MVALVSAWISPTRAWICPADCCERSASLRTSDATTANPRPCSPARAASMAALRASRLVWSARSSMTPRIRPISCGLLPERDGAGRRSSRPGRRWRPSSRHAGLHGQAALLGVAQRLGGVAGDGLGGLGDLGGRGGQLLDRRGRLADRGRLLGGGGRVLLGGGQQLAGRGGDLLAAPADPADQAAEVGQGLVEGARQPTEGLPTVGRSPWWRGRHQPRVPSWCDRSSTRCSSRAWESSRLLLQLAQPGADRGAEPGHGEEQAAGEDQRAVARPA